MLNVENQKSTYSTIVSDGALALSRQIQKACFMHPAHPGTITMDRFTFVPRAQQAQDAGFVSQLSIDSGEGTARYQRFFTFKPVFASAENAVAYAMEQASYWMKHKSLA